MSRKPLDTDMGEVEPLLRRKAWKSLEVHSQDLKRTHLRDLFAADAQRGKRMILEAAGIFLDYSKNRITEQTIELLVQLAEESGLRERIKAMFRGDKINVTEKRAVLHLALRAPKGESIMLDGEDVVPQVHAVLDKMAQFSDRVRSGDMDGPYWQADSQCHQCWHRRVRSGTGYGL